MATRIAKGGGRSGRRALCFLLAAGCFATAGCGSMGRVYTRTVMPFTEDFDATPVGTRRAVLEDRSFKEPITRYGVSAQWSRNAIEQVARDAGITNLCYMDVEDFSLVFGIYRRRRLVIYGD